LTIEPAERTLFVHDSVSVETEYVGHRAHMEATIWYPTLSSDGRFVAFPSYASNLGADCTGIYVHDRQTRQTMGVARVSDGTPSNGASSWPVISLHDDLMGYAR